MNKIVKFDFQEIISYQEYTTIVNELKDWYQDKREYVEQLYLNMLKNKNYEQSTDIMKIHNAIIIELVNKVVDKLDFYEDEMGIFISNSFARETNLLNSDIDINFMYEDESNKVYEELISSIIAEVLSKYRDFVHDSISHRLSNEQLSNDDTVTYELNFTDELIFEEITKGNESLMYKLYNTKKDRESFIKYFIKYINAPELMEWIYYQKIIYDKDDYLKVLFDYIKKLEEESKSFTLEKNITYLVNEIAKEKQEINNLNFDDIASLKRVFKNHGFKVINDFLTILTKSDSSPYKFESFTDKLERIDNPEIVSMIKDYLGHIMVLDYLCEIYKDGFRTRYHQPIDAEFLTKYLEATGENLSNLKEHLLNIYESILYSLDLIARKINWSKLDIETEHINIESYSPLWYVNDVSKEYQKGYYLMPFIEEGEEVIPIHPDTLTDLNIPRSKIVDEVLVYPTSSTRTVYEPINNVCYKLPVLRRITRSIRSLSEKELLRSEIAASYLNNYNYPNFEIIKEDCFHNKNEMFNYIKRYMPNKIVYPWFYLIVSNKFPKSFMLEAIKKIVDIWMYYASHGIYFESFHTQNIMVDEQGKIYYRDLSDVRILEEKLMCPSYLGELKNIAEFHSVSFDRSVIMQNIEHFLKYRQDINDNDIEYIKSMIRQKIAEYKIEFPNYSMNYDTKVKGHHPIPCELVRLRKDKRGYMAILDSKQKFIFQANFNEYLKKYGSFYKPKELEYIKEQFLGYYFEHDLFVDIMSQVYQEIGVFEVITDNIYSKFIDVLCGKFDINQNILDVGCGYMPAFARLVAKKQEQGSVTAIDKNIITTDFDDIKAIKGSFNESFDISNYDLIYGLQPCEATPDMIKLANKYDKDLCILVCGCTHFNTIPIWPINEYMMYQRWLEYLEQIMKNSLPKNREYSFEDNYLYNKYSLITTRRLTKQI